MWAIVVYSAIYFLLFGITEVLYHVLRVRVEYTRKIVHITTGIIALSFPTYMHAFWQVALLCGTFIVILFLSERYRLLKSITAIDRKSHGSWLFAVVVLLCYAVQQYFHSRIYYLIPILILTLADPLAALIGKKTNIIPFNIFSNTKTLGGSLSFYIICIAVFLMVFQYMNIEYSLIRIIIGSTIITLAEALSVKGWDNFTIPTSTIACLNLLLL